MRRAVDRQGALPPLLCTARPEQDAIISRVGLRRDELGDGGELLVQVRLREGEALALARPEMDLIDDGLG